MCEKVAEIEEAIDDVKEMLLQSSGESQGSNKTESWRAEWIAIVQDLIEKDAGWK